MKYFIKIAKKENEEFFSRTATNFGNAVTFGLTGGIQSSAQLGRKALNKKPISKSEAKLFSKMERPEDGKTYPIARFVTNPITSTVEGGIIGTIAGLGATKGIEMYSNAKRGVVHSLSRRPNRIFKYIKDSPGKKAGIVTGVAILGAGISPLFTYINRSISARSAQGKANNDLEGWEAKEIKVINSIKK